jgi:DNA-binding protein YbaB
VTTVLVIAEVSVHDDHVLLQVHGDDDTFSLELAPADAQALGDMISSAARDATRTSEVAA